MAGTLFIVTGPSGAGKDSVIEAVHGLGLEYGSVTTSSTRPMRPGEAEGHPYYFLSRDEFQKKIDNGDMIEWAEVYGNYYGSTREEVEHSRNKHGVVIIKVDPQGARTFKQIITDAVTIFIAPPSFEFLEKRLVNRASDSPEVIQERLERAKDELKNLSQWDYVITNEEGKLQEAAQQLVDIIHRHTKSHPQ